MQPSLTTLPIEVVYCILDFLEPLDILLSVQDVCVRLNAIVNTYRPYEVRSMPARDMFSPFTLFCRHG